MQVLNLCVLIQLSFVTLSSDVLSNHSYNTPKLDQLLLQVLYDATVSGSRRINSKIGVFCKNLRSVCKAAMEGGRTVLLIYTGIFLFSFIDFVYLSLSRCRSGICIAANVASLSSWLYCVLSKSLFWPAFLVMLSLS